MYITLYLNSMSMKKIQKFLSSEFNKKIYFKSISIDGRKKFKDYKDLSEKTRQYYKDNLQNKTVYKENLGNIEFYKKGVEETISKGNLRYIFKVLDIIRTGEVEGPEPLYKERKDKTLQFDKIRNKIKFQGNTKDVLLKIRNMKNGEKFVKDFYVIYDKNKKKGLTRTPIFFNTKRGANPFLGLI